MSVKLGIAKFVQHITSTNFCGGEHMPNDRQQTQWIADRGVEYLAQFGNDALEIWIAGREIGNPASEEWKLFMRTKSFRKLAIWYLWHWVWGEWFGLKRAIWYWALHIIVESYGGPMTIQVMGVEAVVERL